MKSKIGSVKIDANLSGKNVMIYFSPYMGLYCMTRRTFWDRPVAVSSPSSVSGRRTSRRLILTLSSSSSAAIGMRLPSRSTSARCPSWHAPLCQPQREECLQ